MQLLLVALAAVFQAAVGTASSLTPPVIPLIVRNPYLSTWLANARRCALVKMAHVLHWRGSGTFFDGSPSKSEYRLPSPWKTS
jgi:hypothetical protein